MARNHNRFQMKRYKVRYWEKEKSRPFRFTETSKSGRMNGGQISFLVDGRKYWQGNFKNNRWNEICKVWLFNNPKNSYFVSWKKHRTQGMQIIFKI